MENHFHNINYDRHPEYYHYKMYSNSPNDYPILNPNNNPNNNTDDLNEDEFYQTGTLLILSLFFCTVFVKCYQFVKYRSRSDNASDEVLPESTRQRIRNILRVSSKPAMPEAKPSSNNCRYCDWKLGCPNAIETSNEVTADASHFL